MDIVKNASLSCGFTYNIQSTSYGPYLNKINDDSASGTSGWSYFVNSLSPSVGAADYALQPNDEVLWAFGGWNLQPTRTSLSSGQITSGQSLTVNAESFSENAWHPLADADIFYGALTAKTDNNGQVTISPIDGYYKIYAQKSDFVRSDTQSLVVGQPQNSMVTLSANVATGDIKGDATVTPDLIAFTVSPPSLDFGTLASGSNVAKTLNFRNVGSTNLKIQAQTSGDTLFVDYLSLAGASWRSFGLDLPAAGITATQAAIKTPSNVKLSAGQKSGQIIFWANPN